MISLENYLNTLTVSELKTRLTLIPGNSAPTRKADIISLLKTELRPENLESFWQRLSKLEQTAIAETIYHWDNEFYPARFFAKYQNLPTYFSSYASSHKQKSVLGLFFYNKLIITEIANACRHFVKAPADYQLTPCSNDNVEIYAKERQQKILEHKNEVQPELVVLSMEIPAIHDLQAVLNLVDSEKISVSEKTKMPGVATIKKITAVLLGGDYYSEQDDWGLDNYSGGAITPIRAYAWPLLLQSTGLGLVRRVGTKLQLTGKGKKVSKGPIEETISLLYQQWRDKGMLDEFNRISVIKGQTGKGQRLFPVINRRITIENALKACPENEWIAVDDFFRFLQAENYDIRVIYDRWRLYISEINYGSLSYSNCSFEVIQGRYILVYLFEYLATLGMIDVAYLPPYFARDDFNEMQGADDLYFFSRYDGLLFFRINPLGSYCLGRSQNYQPPKQERIPLFSTAEDLTITLQRSATPSEKMILDQYLQAETNGSYVLDQDYLLQAIDQGGDLNLFSNFFNNVSEQPPANAVQEMLALIKERCNVFTDMGNARLMNCSSVALAKMLANDPNIGKYCFHSHDKVLVIPEKSSNAFQRAAKKLGYIVPKKAVQ